MAVTATAIADAALRSKLLVWRAGVAAACILFVWAVRDFRWGVVWDVAPFLLRGLGTSWLLSVVAVVIGMVAGTGLAAARLSAVPGLRQLAVAYIEVVRATPQIMVIFWVFFTYPSLTGETMSAWWAAVIALSMIAAAYLAEVIRAGLLSVPSIQVESAIVCGLDRFQTYLYVLLPQAVRNMVPAFIAHFVMIFKVTSLVYVIGLTDFFRATIIINNRDFAPYALYTTMAVGYFVCCAALSYLVKRIDQQYTPES